MPEERYLEESDVVVKVRRVVSEATTTDASIATTADAASIGPVPVAATRIPMRGLMMSWGACWTSISRLWNLETIDAGARST